MHREFCALFEGFTSGFLEARGVSEAAFGKALRAAMLDREGKPSEGNSEGSGSKMNSAVKS